MTRYTGLAGYQGYGLGVRVDPKDGARRRTQLKWGNLEGFLFSELFFSLYFLCTCMHMLRLDSIRANRLSTIGTCTKSVFTYRDL
jgi:hypothetical protein